MLPTVNKFFCFRLNTGVLIIGYIQIIYAALGIIGAICILADPKDFPDDKDDMVLDHLSITIIYLIVFIFNFVIGFLLVRGVTKERPNLMRPWMVVQMAGVCLASFAVLFYVISFWIFVFKSRNVEAIVAMIISNLVQLGKHCLCFFSTIKFFCYFLPVISFYILVVVNSYHKQLTDSSYQPILSSAETV